MKKWRQKSSCAAIFGNTEVKKKSLPQIALHRYCIMVVLFFFPLTEDILKNA
jgi:hypothetical protein